MEQRSMRSGYCGFGLFALIMRKLFSNGISVYYVLATRHSISKRSLFSGDNDDVHDDDDEDHGYARTGTRLQEQINKILGNEKK